MQDDELARLGDELAARAVAAARCCPSPGWSRATSRLLAGALRRRRGDVPRGARRRRSTAPTSSCAAARAASARRRRRRDRDRGGPAGRRVVVVTIDPARRLADALGLPTGSAAEPQRIDARDGCRGELWAMMLDTAATFDGLVRRARRRRRAGRPHRAEPLLPQHLRRAERHPGVHGVGDAAPAARRRALRPGRRRHAAEPQRARLPRGARACSPASSTTGCSSC